MGPPASGKGTQGRRLAASLGLGYLSTGALLREQMEEGTALGKQAEPILARGEYLPDHLMCPILADWLSRQTGGWVLDGFPRSLPQAVFLDNWLARSDLKLDVAVSLEVPCGGKAARRADDSEENFRNRHSEFMTLTQPVIEHYRRLNLLSSCDAMPPQAEVAAQLLQSLTVGAA